MTSDYQKGASAKRPLDAHTTAIFEGKGLAERRSAEFDANVDRLKACEHIADGDEGWEVLRNECPSTAAVARLRDSLAARDAEIAALRAALTKANYALSCLPECGLVIHRSEANEVSEAIEVIKQATKRPREEDEPRFVPAGPEGMP